MISLILALAGSCAMSWLFKIAGLQGASTRRLAFCNYLIACAGLWVYFLAGCNHTSFRLLTPGFLLLALGLATAMVLNLITLTLGTAACGVNGATFFNRIGFLVSMLLALILWKEIPSLWQLLGITSLLAGLLLMLRSGSAAGRNRKLLAGLCASSGMVIFLNAVYGRLYSGDRQIFFLALVFTAALLMSTALLFFGKKTNCFRLNTEAVIGILIGLTNIVTTLFTLKSYALLPISIVAPVMSGGNMIFSAFLGKTVYHEEFSRTTALSIALAALSLILVNLHAG